MGLPTKFRPAEVYPGTSPAFDGKSESVTKMEPVPFMLDFLAIFVRLNPPLCV